MYTSDAVYKQFIEAFKNEIEAAELSSFESAWQSRPCKTEFYDSFLKSLSDTMKHQLVYEEFRCDYTIKDSNDFPLVRLESENDHATASHEVNQLCQLISPVKVLLISCEWTDSERKKWLPEWQRAIKEFNSSYPTDFKFCIVVGEWGRGNPSDDILRYYVTTLSSDGEIYEEFELQKDK